MNTESNSRGTLTADKGERALFRKSTPLSVGARLWVLASGLAVPLYVFAVLLAVRSGFFNFRARPLQDAQVTAFWAFTGAALGATITLIVAVINRNQAAMSERRLTLDSATAALQLLDSSGDRTYPSPAVVAGSLATLIHLGQPAIALHTLEPIWRAGAIESGVAVWVLGESIKAGSSAERRYACFMLRGNADRLVDLEKDTISWPPAFAESYPDYLTPSNRIVILETIAFLFLSQHPNWWREKMGQLLNALSSIMTQDADAAVRSDAAKILVAVKDVIPAQRKYVTTDGLSTSEDLIRRAEATTSADGYASIAMLSDRLSTWSLSPHESAEESPESLTVTPRSDSQIAAQHGLTRQELPG